MNSPVSLFACTSGFATGINIIVRRILYHILRTNVVDSKGIEPSNLTDANRALSQLSYEPILTYKTIENTAFFDKRM